MKPLIFTFLAVVTAMLATAQDTPFSGGTYDLVTPFAGTWNEYNVTAEGEEELIGTLQSGRETNGCVLSQTFFSPDSSFSYHTFGYVDPVAHIWVETYVFSTGSKSTYHWIVDNGDIVQRRISGTRDLGHMHQLRFIDVKQDSYAVIQEKSTNGGMTWEQTERTNIKRVL